MKRISLIVCFLLALLAKPSYAQFNGDGLKGVYFANTNLTNPVVTVVDPQINYRWFGCPPQPGMSGTSYSIQWTGQVQPAYSEPYTFEADVNGGVSVIVNGNVLVNQWTDYPLPVRGFSGVVTLTAGVKVPIEVDYFTAGANTTSARLQIAWQSASQVYEIIPRDYLFSGAVLNPTPTPQAPEACGAAATGVTVDGALNEWPWSGGGWNSVNRTVLGNVYGTTAAFKTLWDSNNLYLGVTVIDSQLTNNGGVIWSNSTVELYLDTVNSRSLTINNNDFEYFFRWNDTAAQEYQGRTTGVTMATRTITGGYVVEASIPWTTLGLPGPGPGTVLGFDLGLDVNHNGGDCRDGQLIWNGGEDDFANTSGYAELSLGAACPTPVSTPPAPQGGQPYVSPNPSDGDNVRFVYTMAEVGTAKIKIWNAWGNLAADLEGPKGAGLQSSTLNVSTFAPGHYFYRVELDYGSGRVDNFKTQVLAVKK